MAISYCFVIIKLCLLVFLANASLNVNAICSQSITAVPKLNSFKAGDVSFCKIMKTPESYDGKTVSTEAILVRGKTPTVDGGEAFMYSPSCNSKEKRLLVEYRLKSESVEAINGIINRDDNLNTGRAKIKVIALFEVAKGSGFGHLDAFQYKFTITELQRVSTVSKTLAYPKSK
jgi:hypothetical protein